MFEFAIAVFTASLLGSLHCVGMCGPFALWATGSSATAGTSPLVLSSYHLGRLTTYASAGLMAGLIGSTLNQTGHYAGLQMVAAKVAGAGLVIAGVIQLRRRLMTRRLMNHGSLAGGSLAGGLLAGQPGSSDMPKPSRIAGFLHAAKPIIASRGRHGRAYLGGLLTTWLPCGWLYLFVLVAGGTGAVGSSLIVMIAFWVGTLPALSGWVLGVQRLGMRFTSAIPIMTAILWILTGFYTMSGRAMADLSTLNTGQTVQDVTEKIRRGGVEKLCDQPLPCCRCHLDASQDGDTVQQDADGDQ